MRKYSGTWGLRLECLFFIAVACGIIYFGIAIALTQKAGSILGGLAFLILAGTVMTMAGFGLVESSTVISTDSDHIARKGWRGSISMRWDEVTDYVKNGMQDTTVTLKDHSGRDLRIYFTLLTATDRTELLSEIDRRLGSIRDRKEQDLTWSTKSYYPTRTPAYACSGLLLMFIIAGAALCLRPVPDNQRGAFYGLVATIGGMALVFAVFIVGLFAERITVSGTGISQWSWFRYRNIPFDRVSAMDTKEQWSKGRLWKKTTIQGDGKKVVFTSQMEDYPVVCEFIQARTGAMETGVSS